MTAVRFAIVSIALLAACAETASEAPELPAGPGAVNVGSADLPYVVEGSGRPCIVYGSSVYYPRTFSDRFKSELHCVYLDHRGFTEGAQPEPGQTYGIPAIVEDLERARQQLGLDRFVLVGHSIHGLIALAYAQRFPEHVTHVVAIGAPPEYTPAFSASVGEFWTSDASEGRKAQDMINREQLRPANMESLTSGEAFVANYVAAAAHYWADSTFDATALWEGVHVNGPLADQIFDVSRPFSIAAGSGLIDVPAFVALGRLDYAVPYIGWNDYTGPFTDITIRVFERSGHTPQFEDVTAFDDALFDWLAGTEAVSATAHRQ